MKKLDTTGLECPEEVSRDNWEGGYTYSDAFTVKVDQGGVRVDRHGARNWNMNLRFNCLRCETKEEQSRRAASSTEGV